jgi:non-ribosomal peptide synthetase component F
MALADAPTVLDPQPDRPRLARRRRDGDRVPFTIDATATGTIRRFCAQHGVSAYMFMLSAFGVLLHGRCCTDDLLIGSPVENRNDPGLGGLLGLFVNTLPLRSRQVPDETFLDYLLRMRETCLGAYDHQDIPLARLVQELGLQGVRGHSPLVQVVFAFQKRAETTRRFGGLALRSRPVSPRTARFDITLLLNETADGFDGMLEYDSDMFDRATAEGLAREYRMLAERLPQLAAEPMTVRTPA